MSGAIRHLYSRAVAGRCICSNSSTGVQKAKTRAARLRANVQALTSSETDCKIEHMSYQWIRASEIGDYVYCRRSWWLRRVRSVAPINQAQLQAGVEHHRQHNALLYRSILVRRVALVVLFLAVAVLVFELLKG